MKYVYLVELEKEDEERFKKLIQKDFKNSIVKLKSFGDIESVENQEEYDAWMAAG